MPVAEAILASVAVACSNITPLKEIGSDAVVTFDPSSLDPIADVLVKLLVDPTMREFLLEGALDSEGSFRSELVVRDPVACAIELLGWIDLVLRIGSET